MERPPEAALMCRWALEKLLYVETLGTNHDLHDSSRSLQTRRDIRIRPSRPERHSTRVVWRIFGEGEVHNGLANWVNRRSCRSDVGD